MYKMDFGLSGLLYFIMEMAGTLFTSPMIKFLSWTIYLHDFESYPLDREPSYEKAVFVSGLVNSMATFATQMLLPPNVCMKDYFSEKSIKTVKKTL